MSFEHVYALSTSHSSVPATHREAMSGVDAKKWREAEKSKVESHRANRTFGPAVELPQGFRAIKTDWVYDIKRSGRCKARVVVLGYRMMAGVDYNRTFAPTPRSTSIRVVCALVALAGWELWALDIKTAFLSAEMDSEVYVYLPPAFDTTREGFDPHSTSQLCP